MLFRRAEDSEARILTAVGAVATVSAVAAISVAVFANPFAAQSNDKLDITIDTPFVGQGVAAGTPFLLHGLKVGEVTSVTSRSGRQGLQLAAQLQRGPTAGLTDSVAVDFRPANYFGVTGINLVAGQGGQPLTDGAVIKVTPAGNFTVQTLLSRLGELSHGVITPQLIDVIDRSTHYIDGLDPLLETMLTVANSITTVQTVSTERLLRNTTSITVATPGVVNAAMELGDKFVHSGLADVSENFFHNTAVPTMDQISGSFYDELGNLESSHSTDLAPFTAMTKVMTDIVPGLVPPDAVADTARELRERLQRLFTGAPDRPAVNVRVILDSLPGVAAPIDAMGAAEEPAR